MFIEVKFNDLHLIFAQNSCIIFNISKHGSHSVFIVLYRAPAFNPAASLITMCPCGCGKEDHSDNGSTASSGSGGPGGLVNSFSLPSPPPSYQVTLPNTPDLSPLKSQDSFEGPLDMSKTSPVYGVTLTSTGTPIGSSSETPPPSPPENDRDKFRCLYLLVDAAVGQLEELERQKQKPGGVCAWKIVNKTAESKRSKQKWNKTR